MLGIISGSVLIYQWWARQQKLSNLQTQLEQLQNQARQQYQLQNTNLISTASLAESPVVHSFFTDLLNTYAYKFAKIKKLNISNLPLEFEGFYIDQKTGNGFGEMGRCWKEKVIYPIHQKLANISLNRLYLLNKFGHDKYFTSYPSGDYSYLDISFDKMLNTCSHELAHYIQLVKHGKSSCESDLILNNGNYDRKLEQEHKEFTKEIYQLIKNSGEYLEWERRWNKIQY